MKHVIFTFEDVKRTAHLYNDRFAHLAGRSVDNDILPAFGVRNGTVRDLDPSYYGRFVRTCDLYIADADDELVVLVK